MTIKRTSLFIAAGMLAGAVTLFTTGCGNDSEHPDTAKDTLATSTEEAPKTEKKSIFYSLPSPIQLGKLLKRAGANYDNKILNAKDNVAKYADADSKALNLGVYGADLSYAAIFGQTQDVLSFLNCAKKLADELGTSGAFSSESIKRIETNSSNNDSLLHMIADLYMNSDQAMKENEQTAIASLAIAGGFIEGLYIGTQVAKTSKDKAAVEKRLAEMKGAITNLVGLLESQPTNDRMTGIINELKGIKAIYDEMATGSTASSVKTDTTTKVATIGGAANYNLTQEQITMLTSKMEALRANIIKF